MLVSLLAGYVQSVTRLARLLVSRSVGDALFADAGHDAFMIIYFRSYISINMHSCTGRVYGSKYCVLTFIYIIYIYCTHVCILDICSICKRYADDMVVKCDAHYACCTDMFMSCYI